MAWMDAHLRRELVSPTSWQGGGCFLFSCPGRQGGALFPAVGSTIQGEGWGMKVSSGSDIRRETRIWKVAAVASAVSAVGQLREGPGS